ncbi:MAG TPA: hypothetical protein PKM97_03740 [Bacteroidia bacterium]|nr:hypothetical protein [Bacteroidia bacterium]
MIEPGEFHDFNPYRGSQNEFSNAMDKLNKLKRINQYLTIAIVILLGAFVITYQNMQKIENCKVKKE